MATVQFYPSKDGRVYRGSVDETFSTIRSGNGSATDSPGQDGFYIYASTTSNQYQYLIRSLFSFDTSTLTSSATISSASFFLWVVSTGNGLGGGGACSIVNATPSNPTSYVAADYGQLGTTKLASDIAMASLTNGAYNEFAMNASGLSNINKTGTTVLGGRINKDADNTVPSSWSSNGDITVTCRFSPYVDTSSDPYLEVTYTTGTTVNPAKTTTSLGLTGIGS